jgi:hypothetical protein
MRYPAAFLLFTSLFLFACGSGAKKSAKPSAAATTAAKVDTSRADPVGGGCPVDQPVRATAQKLAYATDHPGYAGAQPLACFVTVDAAVKAGNKAAPTPSPSPTATPTPVPTVPQFTGVIMGVITAPSCFGGYAIGNASITIRDESDKIIAVGTTDQAELKGSGCVATFTVTKVPKAKFYQIKIGTHNGPTYSFEDLQAEGWTLKLFLGGD